MNKEKDNKGKEQEEEETEEILPNCKSCKKLVPKAHIYFTCARCHNPNQNYCCKECQKSAWSTHKLSCFLIKEEQLHFPFVKEALQSNMFAELKLIENIIQVHGMDHLSTYDRGRYFLYDALKKIILQRKETNPVECIDNKIKQGIIEGMTFIEYIHPKIRLRGLQYKFFWTTIPKSMVNVIYEVYNDCK